MAEREKDADAKAQLAEALWNDPDTRPLIEEAVIKKFPNAAHHLPNVQMRQESAKILAEAEKIRDETLQAIRDRDAREALKLARDEIMADPELHIRAEEIEEIEKLMLDPTIGPIGSHKTAARVYRAQQQVASPKEAGFRTMQVPGLAGAGGDDFSWLAPGIGRPMELDAATRRRAEQIMHDFANGRGSKWE